jgi:hypothetical protein
MPPQFQQYEVGLKRRIGGQVRPPESTRVLAAQQKVRRSIERLRARRYARVRDL